MVSSPAIRRFAVVLALTGCAVVISLALRAFISPDYSLVFIAAVLASAWFYGKQGGILATVLGVIAIEFVFLARYFSFAMETWYDVGRLIAFALVALLITYLVEELRHSKERLAATLSSIGDAVIVTNEKAQITFLNPAAEALLACRLDVACERPFEEIVHLKDESTRERIEPPLKQVLKDGIPVQAGSHTLLVAKDGREVWIEENAAAIRDKSGKINGAILVFRDITRRKQVQEQISESQKMEAVGRLAGGVAGDFNNLLTVITGYSEMLRSELTIGDPLRRFAEEILSSAERAAGLIRQLLSLSKGQLVQAKLLDLNALIGNMDKMLRRLLGEKIDLILLPGPGVFKVKSDPGQIEQVIVNLAMNSRDAMPQGGKFVIETSNIEIGQKSEAHRPGVEPGSYVMIAVSDTGVGMDVETRSKLFEPFFTTKDRGKGSGLGLSIVYGIVRQNQGYINVYSQQGAGTIFEIYVPSARESTEPVHRGKPGRGPKGSETILIADDEDSVRKLVYAVLATHGYNVFEARDGEEAFDIYEKNQSKIDMVLTDVVMPRMNGFELGQRLASTNPAIAILYMSGYRDSTIGAADADIARSFLNKPFTPDVLLVKVREVLDARKTR